MMMRMGQEEQAEEGEGEGQPNNNNNNNNNSNGKGFFSAMPPFPLPYPPPPHHLPHHSSMHGFPQPPQFSFAAPPPPPLPPPLPSPSPSAMGLRGAVARLRELALEAEDAVLRIVNMTHLELPKKEEEKEEEEKIEPELVACPFDPSHRIPPCSLFKHSLTCPPPPTSSSCPDLREMASSFLSPRAEAAPDGNPGSPPTGVADRLNIVARTRENSGCFFYKDCPAVVRIPPPLSNDLVPPSVPSFTTLNQCEEGSIWSLNKAPFSMPLLPSRYWLLDKELLSWDGIPIQYSNRILQAAMGLGQLERKPLKHWVSSHSPSFGLILDPALADHITSLAVFCLQSICKEATALFSKGKSEKGGANIEAEQYPCRDLHESGRWLSSQLSCICDKTNGFVLALFTHALRLSGQKLASPFVSFSATRRLESLLRSKMDQNATEIGKGPSDGKGASESHLAQHVADLSRTKDFTTIDEMSISVSEVVSGLAAIQERAVFDQCKRHCIYVPYLLRTQMSSLHNAAVRTAEEERSKRANLRAVLEHDGLSWLNSQRQNGNKNKTREEILAEERDYKRRRMSYRGKKQKRTPLQVLHDIIEDHMQEIMASGGIGCFGKPELPNQGGDGSKVERAAMHEKDGYKKDRHEKDGYKKDGHEKDGYKKDGNSKHGYEKDGYKKDVYKKDGYENEKDRYENSLKYDSKGNRVRGSGDSDMENWSNPRRSESHHNDRDAPKRTHNDYRNTDRHLGYNNRSSESLRYMSDSSHVDYHSSSSRQGNHSSYERHESSNRKKSDQLYDSRARERSGKTPARYGSKYDDRWEGGDVESERSYDETRESMHQNP